MWSSFCPPFCCPLCPSYNFLPDLYCSPYPCRYCQPPNKLWEWMEPYLEDEEVSDQSCELWFNRQKGLRYFAPLFFFFIWQQVKECCGVVHLFCIFVLFLYTPLHTPTEVLQGRWWWWLLFLYFRLEKTCFQNKLTTDCNSKNNLAILESIMVSFYKVRYESIVKYSWHCSR